VTVSLNLVHVSIILLIFILTYIGIIHPKIDKTLAAIIGAIVATLVIIFLNIPDPHHVGDTITEQGLLHFQDLEIIALIIGTLIIKQRRSKESPYLFWSFNTSIISFCKQHQRNDDCWIVDYYCL